MAKSKSKSPAKSKTDQPAATNFHAKVKGENKWLAHDGTKFFISDKVEEATEFSAAYVKKIAASKWGGKDWESKKA